MSTSVQLKIILNVVLAFIFSLLLSACAMRALLTDVPRDGVNNEVKVWFVKAQGDQLSLIPVVRKHFTGDKLTTAVKELLSGPTEQEQQAGLASEIPKGTILLGLHSLGDALELNLSRRFASGGGTDSLAMRVEQLSKTVALAAGGRKVYLMVEGQRVSAAAGEGLEITQPLN